jgi:hypothetical protein
MILKRNFIVKSMVKIEILKLKDTLLIFTQIQSFIDLNPIIQALIVTSFTWFVTAMEASLVFLLKDMNGIPIPHQYPESSIHTHTIMCRKCNIKKK